MKHLEKYGPDFFRKLPKYRTATWNGQHVAICEVAESRGEWFALIRPAGHRSVRQLVNVNELDNFVL